jgi:hypothetical protein
MANIKVRDLTNIAGADLFNDSESFMRYLSDDELSVQGGGSFIVVTAIVTIAAMANYAYLKYQEMKPDEPSDNSYSSR